MIKTQYINLNMIPSGVMPILYCSQYDVGRPLGMVVYNGGEAVDLDDYTVTIEATRSDGTAITAGVVTDGNIGAFSTTATMTNLADKYPAKLVIVDSDSRRVASLAFVLCVTPKTMDENADNIEEDAPLYQQYTGTVQTIIAAIRADLSAETRARQDADTLLRTSIIEEQTARANAIESVSNQLTIETNARTTADATLQSQINQIVAPSGEAPSAAEVANARIGVDGTTYDSLGNAIRGQVTDLQTSIDVADSEIFNRIAFDWQSIGTTEFPTGFRTGNYSTEDGSVTSSAHALRSVTEIPYNPDTTYLYFTCPVGKGVRVAEYNSAGTYITTHGAISGSGKTTSLYVPVVQTHKYKVTFGVWTETLTNESLTNEFVNAFTCTVFDSNVNVIENNLSFLEGLVVNTSVFDWQSIGTTEYPSGFRTGLYSAEDGSATSTSHSIRSVSTIPYGAGVVRFVIAPPEGYKAVFSEYTSGGTFIRRVGSEANGAEVSIDVVQGNLYRVHFGVWTASLTNDDLTDEFVNAFVMTVYESEIEKKEDAVLQIKHESGSFNYGEATERISIFIPAASGYILYRLYHFVNATINNDAWQVYNLYYTPVVAGGTLTDLTVAGEWECAVHLDGRDDFSGGHTHGDEVMTGVITVLVDGVPTSLASLGTLRECKEVRIIETSTLYDPADHTTAIASHGREYVFDKDGMTINQSLKWLVAETLTNCYMAMFLPRKTMIDRAITNRDFEVLTLASAATEPLSTISKHDATAVTMWDTSGGFSAEVSVPVYPTGLTGGDMVTIGDNGGGSYNKVYFKVCGGGSSTVGELWKSKAVYKLNYSE